MEIAVLWGDKGRCAQDGGRQLRNSTDTQSATGEATAALHPYVCTAFHTAVHNFENKPVVANSLLVTPKLIV